MVFEIRRQSDPEFLQLTGISSLRHLLIIMENSWHAPIKIFKEKDQWVVLILDKEEPIVVEGESIKLFEHDDLI